MARPGCFKFALAACLATFSRACARTASRIPARRRRMRAVDASEALRTALRASGAAHAEADDGTRYRAQQHGEAEVRIRRFRPPAPAEPDSRPEEIDFEPGDVVWEPV